MGREVRRVPYPFIGPGDIWPGFIMEAIECFHCGGSGEAPYGAHKSCNWNLDEKPDSDIYESFHCPVCEGEGEVHPKIDIPFGPGYQMWETTSEGSPMSPSFEKPEELARWLTENNASAFGSMTASYDDWMRTIVRGWSPSAVIKDGTLHSGVSGLDQ